MKKKVNVVKLVMEVLLIILLTLEVFFMFLFAINPVMITIYILAIIPMIALVIYLTFGWIGKICIRRYKQKMILHQIRLTDKISYIQMREIEEY